MTRIAVLQMDCVEGARQHNLDTVAAAAREAAERGCDILALPELWCSGYDLASSTAETWGIAELEFLRGLSREHGMALLGGSLLLENGNGGRYANTAVAVESGDDVARYAKLHLFRPLAEHRHLAAGSRRPQVFRLAGLRCAMAVCYDLRFSELFRGPAAAGLDLLDVPAQWPSARIGHWRALLTARAIESQCFVLGVNRRGRFGDTEFGGCSLLVDPWGDVVLDAGTENGLHIAELDPAMVEEARTRLPVLEDRREDLYPLP